MEFSSAWECRELLPRKGSCLADRLSGLGAAMYERILHRMREKVRLLDYIVSIHAEDEMDEDEYSILDVENGILTGLIIQRQNERATGEVKYLLRGRALDEEDIWIVAKFGVTGKLIIITIFAPET